MTLNLSSFKKKNFFTGVSGSGKTSLAKQVSQGINSNFIPFDDFYKYNLVRVAEGLKEFKYYTRAENVLSDASSLVYEIMGQHERYCMDALPACNEIDIDKLIIYSEEREDISITIIKCSKESWIKRKSGEDDFNAEEYDDFYYANGGAIHFWKPLLDSNQIFFYNSDTKSFCKSLEELYEQT